MLNDTDTVVKIAEDYGLSQCLDFLKEFIEQREEGMSFFPLLFQDVFNIKKDTLHKIASASNLYFWSLLIVDKLIDEKQRGVNKEAILLSHLLREKSLGIMYSMFVPSHEFWDVFDKYVKEYIHAVLLESDKHFGIINPYSLEEAIIIYTGNAAIAKAAVAAIAYYNNKADLIPFFERSIDNFNIAKNLEDDIWDWKMDFKNKQYSYFLTNLLFEFKLDNKVETIEIEELGKYVFFSGKVDEILDKAIFYYTGSLNKIEHINSTYWKQYIKKSTKKCIALKKDINKLVEKQLIIANYKKDSRKTELRLPKPTNTHQKIINDILKYIEKQWGKNFIEASNNQYFKDMHGFRFNPSYHISDVFQRAVILEILVDVNKLYPVALKPIIDKELEYLIKSKISEDGWNFYPTLNLQPSDTDTTAQVLQSIIKFGKMELAEKLGAKPVKLLLSEKYNDDGSFGTWLIPREKIQSQLHINQVSFFEDYCKLNIIDNKDTEVIANMLYTLYLFDKKEYIDIINKGIVYLESVQSKKGNWGSSWYYGPLYATYLCIRVITLVKPQSKSLKKALIYLVSTQNKDGGWSAKTIRNAESDVLNTAYALICFGYLKTLDFGEVESIVEKGFGFLIQFHSNNDEWPRCDFINLLKNTNSVFRSRTITVAYVLKAFTYWKNIEE